MIKKISEMVKKICDKIYMFYIFCFVQVSPVFATSSSGTGLVDDMFLVVEGIIGALAVFCVIQGAMAYSESKMEGASAQASGKAFGFFAAATGLAILLGIIELRLKARILSFFSSGS